VSGVRQLPGPFAPGARLSAELSRALAQITLRRFNAAVSFDEGADLVAVHLNLLGTDQYRTRKRPGIAARAVCGRFVTVNAARRLSSEFVS
jgi:hypothetical protein